MASYEGCTQIIDPLCECQNQVGIKGRAREARWEAAGNVNTPPSSIMKRHCGSCHCSCPQVTEKLTVSKYKSLIAVILKPSTVIRGKGRGVALNAFLPNQCCKLRYLIEANCCLLRNAFSQMQAVLGSERGDQIQSYTVLCPRRAKKSMSIFFFLHYYKTTFTVFFKTWLLCKRMVVECRMTSGRLVTGLKVPFYLWKHKCQIQGWNLQSDTKHRH